MGLLSFFLLNASDRAPQVSPTGARAARAAGSS